MSAFTIAGLAYSAIETVIGKWRPLGAGSLPELLLILLFKGVTLFKSSKNVTEQGGSMSDVEGAVLLPPNSYTLAQALGKLVNDLIAAKKSGLSGAALYAAIGEDVISDLGAALPVVSAAEGEALSEPVGVAEAFTIVGFGVARSLTGK